MESDEVIEDGESHVLITGGSAEVRERVHVTNRGHHDGAFTVHARSVSVGLCLGCGGGLAEHVNDLGDGLGCGVVLLFSSIGAKHREKDRRRKSTEEKQRTERQTARERGRRPRQQRDELITCTIS